MGRTKILVFGRRSHTLIGWRNNNFRNKCFTNLWRTLPYSTTKTSTSMPVRTLRKNTQVLLLLNRWAVPSKTKSSPEREKPGIAVHLFWAKWLDEINYNTDSYENIKFKVNSQKKVILSIHLFIFEFFCKYFMKLLGTASEY